MADNATPRVADQLSRGKPESTKTGTKKPWRRNSPTPKQSASHATASKTCHFGLAKAEMPLLDFCDSFGKSAFVFVRSIKQQSTPIQRLCAYNQTIGRICRRPGR